METQEDILVPTFYLWQPGDKTLAERFAETVELREQLVENMRKDWEETINREERLAIEMLCDRLSERVTQRLVY